MKILFLDVDGPMIPGRMWFNDYRSARLPDNTGWRYDPVAVDMLNYLTNRHNIKIVYNSMHCPDGLAHMRRQAETNGLKNLHVDAITLAGEQYGGDGKSRLAALNDWLSHHAEVKQWCVVDDVGIPSERAVLVNYQLGLTMSNFEQIERLMCDDAARHLYEATFKNGVHG